MIPILRRMRGTSRRARRARSWPSRMTAPLGRDLVADEQLDQGRLAGSGRPDEEDEVALGDDEVDVAQGDVAVRVGLGDVVQDDDGPIDREPRSGRARRGVHGGSGGGSGGGQGHDQLRGGGPDRRGSPITGSRLRPRARTREPRPAEATTLGRDRWSSEQPGRDREVAGEVGERAVPAQQDGRPSIRRPAARSVGISLGAPPSTQTACAPRAGTAAARWPTTGPRSAPSRTAIGPIRPTAPGVAVAERGAVRAAVQEPWRPSARRKRGRPGVSTPSSSRSSASTVVRELAVAGAAGRALGDRLERDRHDPRRKGRERLRPADHRRGGRGRASGARSRSSRRAPSRSAEGVSTAVASEPTRSGGGSRRSRSARPSPCALRLGADEQHRQEPERPALDGRSRSRRSAPCRRRARSRRRTGPGRSPGCGRAAGRSGRGRRGLGSRWSGAGSR